MHLIFKKSIFFISILFLLFPTPSIANSQIQQSTKLAELKQKKKLKKKKKKKKKKKRSSKKSSKKRRKKRKAVEKIDEDFESELEELDLDDQEDYKSKKKPSELSLYLAEKLMLSNGFGLASLSKDGSDWRAGGTADITILFDLPKYKFQNLPVIIGGRYSAIDVAPKIKKTDGSFEEYVGVVEMYGIGAHTFFDISPEIRSPVGLELSFIRSNLDDQLNLAKPDNPEGTGFGLTFVLGAEKKLFRTVWLGGDFKFGLGTFSYSQVSLRSKFVF